MSWNIAQSDFAKNSKLERALRKIEELIKSKERIAARKQHLVQERIGEKTFEFIIHQIENDEHTRISLMVE